MKGERRIREWVECKLWFTQRGRMSGLSPQCSDIRVRLGYTRCQYQTTKRPPSLPDTTDVCQRAQRARVLGSIDKN